MQNITILKIETVIKAIEQEIGEDKVIMTTQGDNVIFMPLSDAYSSLQYLQLVKMKLMTRGFKMIPVRRPAENIMVFKCKVAEAAEKMAASLK